MRSTRTFTSVEVHAEGEPGRVVTSGIPNIPGKSVFEKQQWLEHNQDVVRTLMLQEPRGYPALCCNLLVPPCDPSADAGFIIMEQMEYPPMSGSNLICVTTVLLETGIVQMVEPETHLTLETPAGLIKVTAICKDGKVTKVQFRNVPAFVMALDQKITVPDMGEVSIDIVWGGMFFVLADADTLGVSLDPRNGREIIKVSETLRHAAATQFPVSHPTNPTLKGPTITNLWAAPTAPGTDGRGVITLSTGAFDPSRPHLSSGVFDRSPCGTGTCAKMAMLHARGLLPLGQDYVNAGPLGTTFTGRLVEETTVGDYPAVVPTLSGQAWIYGQSHWHVDPTDPFQNGYTIGDIW